MIKAYAAAEPGGQLEPFEYDPGPLGTGDVEIAVESCGICHSDLSMLNNDWGSTTYPFVPGHEVIGKIAAVGEGVTRVAVGDTVGLGWHAGYCMTCNTCMSGDHNLCGSASATIVGRHGGFADKVRAQESSVVPLPEGIDHDKAGPLFCAGITVFNPFVQFDIKPTERVAVIGIGGLGHLAIQFAKAWGCEVTAFTSTEAKADEAKALGASDILNTTDAEALASARGRFDLILSTVNVKLDWNLYLKTLAPKGRLHLVGAVPEPLDLAVPTMIGGQYQVSSSPVGSPAVIERMLKFAAHHNIKAQSEYFSFDQANEAFAHLKSGKARYRIILKN